MSGGFGLGPECIGKFCEESKDKHSDIIILHRHDAEIPGQGETIDEYNTAIDQHGKEKMDSGRTDKSDETRAR